MCYTCVSLLVVPIFCTLETILRVIMTIALAAEDLLRLVIQAIHSWVSTILHAVAIIPLWFVFCCSQKCFCSQICAPSCSPACYPMRSNCGCFLFLTMTLVFILVYLFTNWWEDLFATFGLEFPCFYEKTADKAEPKAENKNKSEPMIEKLAHKRVLSTKKSADKRHTIKSTKHLRKPARDMVHEIKNDLDVSYIDYFKERKKENASKSGSDEMNFTYVTVTVHAILEEPDDKTSR